MLLVAFFLWERRAKAPMLPLTCSASAASRPPTASSFLMYFGMFGSVFLLVQFFQVVQGLNPFEAGLRTLPWTAMPVFVAPDRRRPRAAASAPRPIIVDAAWRCCRSASPGSRPIVTPTVDVHRCSCLPFVISGVGMGMFFAPIANVVLSAVRRDEEGKASGANNAIREVGGVFGVAVLASVFSANGSYFDPQAYVDGLVPAVWVGAAVVAVAAVVALFIPNHVVGQVEDDKVVVDATAELAAG